MPEQFEIRSRESQEIMGTPPSWILRSGITVLFVVIILILTATYFIKYPDVIKGKIVITTAQPPAKLVAQTSGKLMNLFVKNNDTVHAGDYLAVIENVADPIELQQVSQMLMQLHDSMKVASATEVPIFVNSNLQINLAHLQVGEIQGALNDFVGAVDQYNFFNKSNIYKKKIGALVKQSNTFKSLNTQLEQQQEVLKEKLELDKDRMKKNEELANEKIISTQDMEASRKQYLDQLYTFQNTKSSVVQNKLQAQEYEKSILDLQMQYDEKKNELLLKLQTSFDQLNSQFKLYEQRYVIKAPINGKVSFFKFWTVNQFVQSGEPVLTIVPPSEDLLGKALVPASGSGKIAVGQTVKIKLDNYPFQQFGILVGTVKNISSVPQESFYSIDVSLNTGLTTSYKKDIPMQNEMGGSAEIVTEDLRLTDRIFYQFKDLKDNQ